MRPNMGVTDLLATMLKRKVYVQPLLTSSSGLFNYTRVKIFDATSIITVAISIKIYLYFLDL